MAHRSPLVRVLRIVAPVLVLLGAVGLFILMISGPGTRRPATPTPPSPAATAPATDTTAPPSATTTPATAAATPAAPTPTADSPTSPGQQLTASPSPALSRLAAKPWPSVSPILTANFTPLGSLQAASAGNPKRLALRFSEIGAGIASLTLANHFTTIHKGAANEILQQQEQVVLPVLDAQGQVVRQISRTVVPFAMLGVWVDTQFVELASNATGPYWRELAPGKFEAIIADAEGRDVLRVTRTFTLPDGRYDLLLDQTIENLSPAPLKVSVMQYGPIDLPTGVIRYGGDLRRLRFAFLSGLANDPGQAFPLSGSDSAHLVPHATALGDPTWNGAEWTFPDKAFWPDPAAQQAGISLAWAALQNRYFAVAVHAVPDKQPPRTDITPAVADKRLNGAALLDRVVLSKAPGNATKADVTASAVMALRMTGTPTTIAPGASTTAAVGIYAGPVTRTYTNADPVLRGMGLGELVIFTFGGPCAFCTFQPVAHLLRWYLGFLHDWIVFDWAIAIILLVFTVRTLLHPITRWSQSNMTRFGKQMAALAPKQAKLKEKYGHDQAKFREELTKLMREEKINYSGALGCLPMFLQMPVWIALYAMIFFTFELRHEGAFFGLFQAVTAGNWGFLGDLAEPDHFLNFNWNLHVPLLSSLMGPIDGLNILPIIMGFVFYAQQKYMTPPTAATLTPEQETQQQIMKIMMVVMFPFFMYNAPAALSLYFMTNSILGIIESRWIRKKVDEEDAEREARKAAGLDRFGAHGAEPEKKPGFFARLQNALEEKQKEIERVRREQEKRKNKGR